VKVQDVILRGSRGEKVEFWWEEDGGRRHTYSKEFEGSLSTWNGAGGRATRSMSGKSWKST